MAYEPIEEVQTIEDGDKIIIRRKGMVRKLLALMKLVPKRIETYTKTADANGVATFTFSPAFSKPPTVKVLHRFSGATDIPPNQYFGGNVRDITAQGCTVDVKRSRGTLILTTGPFEAAPSASVTIEVIG